MIQKSYKNKDESQLEEISSMILQHIESRGGFLPLLQPPSRVDPQSSLVTWKFRGKSTVKHNLLAIQPLRANCKINGKEEAPPLETS